MVTLYRCSELVITENRTRRAHGRESHDILGGTTSIDERYEKVGKGRREGKAAEKTKEKRTKGKRK